MEKIKKFFNFKGLDTNFQTEILAGLTAFFSMSYILIVNPKILEMAGMDFGASLSATILAAVFGCFFMGLYAKKPFALAPYMGEVVFVTYTLVLLLGYSWQEVLGAIFLCGAILFILTLFNIRSWLVQSIPMSLKYAFSSGFGMMLILLGLVKTKILVLGDASVPIHLGNLFSRPSILTILGILIMVVLMSLRFKGAILLGIFSITILSLLTGEIAMPQSFFSLPSSISPIALKLDLGSLLTPRAIPLCFIMLIVMFTDTMGTLISLSMRLNTPDSNTKLKKPMIVDSISTIFSSLIGTITTGSYLESAVGIESGGKTGFSAIITGLLFLLGLFIAPILTIIPTCAYSPALITVGALMLSSFGKLNFEDITEWFPSTSAILLTAFTCNIGIGMALGFIIYPILKLLSKRGCETNSGHWILAVISILFFVIYPYN